MSTSKLFSPIRIGKMELKHRVVLAPLTRFRANLAHVPSDLMVTYYEQRATTPGTLLITEATFIAAEAGGMPNVPGIWNDEQIHGWKRVTDKVHKKQSFIYLQLWATGRSAFEQVLKQEGGYDVVSSSDIPRKDRTGKPRPLTEDEIGHYVQLYATAAKNAIEAGFDGVEIHSANGYLIDQFLQDIVNKRTDEYGGSIENRARFALEVAQAVVDAVGEERTGVRMSPWSRHGDMKEDNPIPTFSYVIQQLYDRFPKLAYLHLVEPPIETAKVEGEPESNDFARAIWKDRPFIVAGTFQPETAKATVDKMDGLVAFGRWFISNPDLPRKIQLGRQLTPYNTDTFYKKESPDGYIDYPFLDEKTA